VDNDTWKPTLRTTHDMWKQIEAQAQDQQTLAMLPGEVYKFPPLPTRPPGLSLPDRARELFLKRMGSIRAEMKVAVGDLLACHVYGETVYVFFCFSGREGVVKENIDLFPSDQLITQFRMILS
jgi:hypothetical protein